MIERARSTFSPVLAVFAIPAGDFTRVGWSALVISPYPYGTERARSTFPLFSLAHVTTLRGFRHNTWPFHIFLGIQTTLMVKWFIRAKSGWW